jgi:uncharacterized protein YoxC
MPDAGHAEALLDDVAAEQARLRPLASTVPALEQSLVDVQQRIARLEGSVSWRVTTPLRAARALIAGRRALVLRVGRRLRARLES